MPEIIEINECFMDRPVSESESEW